MARNLRARAWRRHLHPATLLLLLVPVAATATLAQDSAPLPADVVSLIRDQWSSPDMPESRYLSGAVDLSGDGRPELVVHVVGPFSCGTGGCPTLVLTPEAGKHRLVSTISVSRPPIRVAAAESSGWRNLIVRVAGGGARVADAELLFDGRTYPENPTVSGPRVKPADLVGAEVVIADFGSFQDAKPLPAAGAAASSGSSRPTGAGATPSFDCAKATTATERQICADPELARLDRELATAWNRGLGQWTQDDQRREREVQRGWVADRDACAQLADARGCVRSAYQRRLIELQIRNGELVAPRAVGYLCQGHEGKPFFAAFYSQTDPPSVVLSFGDRQEILFAATSGSGARYANPRVEFSEHHGEASVTWSGESFTCSNH